MSLDIYPLQFKPILKERIFWGGRKAKKSFEQTHYFGQNWRKLGNINY